MPISLTTDLACALDPARLFRSATGHTPDTWQAKLLRSTAPRILLNCCRQSGKSTAVSALAVHAAIYQSPALVLLLSPSLRQSQELYRKVAASYRAIGRPSSAVYETTTHIELANGSRIISLPESEETIRGFSGVSIIIADEAARIADALIDAVLPMLAVSRGRLLLLSTPWGKQGYFYEAWTNGGDRWERYKVTALDCPRIPPDLLEESHARGTWHYQQEWMGEFGEREDAVFDVGLLRSLVRSDLPALDDVIPLGVS